MNNQDKILNCALKYAKNGWFVLPLNERDKQPVGQLVPHGVKNASRDEKIIKNWFHKSNHNLGIATGPKSQIWVLDIDGPVGCLVWWDWEATNGPVFTAAQRTGRLDGGRQLIFKYPRDYTIKTRANIKTGLDVRGENGYIVAPPSIHPSGKKYRWEGRIPINHAPPKLLELVGTKKHPTTAPPKTSKTSRSSNSKSSNYGQAVTFQLLEELSSCGRGGRDQAGYRVAVRLLELEKSGDIEPGTAEHILYLGLDRCGYLADKRHERGERGFHRILNSAKRKIGN